MKNSESGMDLFATWGHAFSRPLYILGPCSAESEEQVLQTAEELAGASVPLLFRAGIWKPRTRPGTFEGRGVQALPWMQKVKEKYGFPICTEVANAEHVEQCLAHGIDALWIGARTTVSPFAVQEIADALRGVHIPVMVKNPIHPDMGLWLGAIERIRGAGIEKIAAIHRGFHYLDNYPYRNRPNWELALELKRSHPDLPIICDASHISGSPELIPHVAQRAMDLNMDGLLIETHPEPSKALSDAKQQVKPKQLFQILNQLEIRQGQVVDENYSDAMSNLRAQVDNIDESIMELLAERMRAVEKIGRQKREQNASIFQLDRWIKVRENYMDWGMALGLREEFVQQMLQAIHMESIEVQEKIMQSEN